MVGILLISARLRSVAAADCGKISSVLMAYRVGFLGRCFQVADKGMA